MRIAQIAKKSILNYVLYSCRDQSSPENGGSKKLKKYFRSDSIPHFGGVDERSNEAILRPLITQKSIGKICLKEPNGIAVRV